MVSSRFSVLMHLLFQMINFYLLIGVSFYNGTLKNASPVSEEKELSTYNQNIKHYTFYLMNVQQASLEIIEKKC